MMYVWMNKSNPSPITEAVPHLRSSWLAHSILDLKHALELLDVFLDILQEKIIRVSPKKNQPIGNYFGKT